MEENKIEITSKICSACKIDFPLNLEHFKQKRNGTFNKQCKHCCEMKIRSQIKNKCQHNRRKQFCIECEGASICHHQKRRNLCKVCNDPIPITIKGMINHSKFDDKKKGKYDQTNFIDYCFVENMIEDCEDKCFYCKCELQYVVFDSNLATIERINNSIGHIKGNCVIACHRCNVSKVGEK